MVTPLELNMEASNPTCVLFSWSAPLFPNRLTGYKVTAFKSLAEIRTIKAWLHVTTLCTYTMVFSMDAAS